MSRYKAGDRIWHHGEAQHGNVLQVRYDSLGCPLINVLLEHAGWFVCRECELRPADAFVPSSQDAAMGGAG